MECSTGPWERWNIPTTPSSSYSIPEMLAHHIQLSRLEFEKEKLENDLASCVTYLQVLRKRQTQNERRLHGDSSLPRKKRKKILQSMRELDKEIKYRERDEEACLNNLQACKANIYIAETVSSPSTTCSTIPDLASNSTLCSYPEEVEPTESTWNGWAGQTAQSPFQKNCGNPSYMIEVAPDSDIGKTELEPCRSVEWLHCGSPHLGHNHATRPVPTNGALTQFMPSPEAAVFEPQAADKDREEDLDHQLAQLDLSSSLASTGLTRAASSAGHNGHLINAETVATSRSNPVDKTVEQTGNENWVGATPQQQQRPLSEAGRVKYRRSRTNSV